MLLLSKVKQDGDNNEYQDVQKAKSPVIFRMSNSFPFKVEVITHVDERQAYQTKYNKIFQDEFF
jgi:hypothetical protein